MGFQLAESEREIEYAEGMEAISRGSRKRSDDTPGIDCRTRPIPEGSQPHDLQQHGWHPFGERVTTRSGSRGIATLNPGLMAVKPSASKWRLTFKFIHTLSAP